VGAAAGDGGGGADRVGPRDHFGAARGAYRLSVGARRAFRDALVADAELRAAYAARKRALIAAGLIEGVAYAEAKSDFVRATLRALGLT
jgi:hypothetical protein